MLDGCTLQDRRRGEMMAVRVALTAGGIDIADLEGHPLQHWSYGDLVNAVEAGQIMPTVMAVQPDAPRRLWCTPKAYRAIAARGRNLRGPKAGIARILAGMPPEAQLGLWTGLAILAYLAWNQISSLFG